MVAHYGALVPIGGGALCGKDPYKIDRAGALRVRQIAVRLVHETETKEAFVLLGYLPGQREPYLLRAKVDKVCWDAKQIQWTTYMPDLTIAGMIKQLELAGVCWQDVLAKRYFGNSWEWEE